MLRISAIVLESSHPQDSITDLLRRLDLGIPTAALVLTRLQVVLSRGEILSFWRAGILTATQITKMTLSEMESLMGRRAKSLHRQFKGSA
ncbi:MAG: box helicase domain protein [Gammaproteobacteria bacterium]|nr:box helicase domain protein [Gammaproteobacteria bacterium]